MVMALSRAFVCQFLLYGINFPHPFGSHHLAVRWSCCIFPLPQNLSLFSTTLALGAPYKSLNTIQCLFISVYFYSSCVLSHWVVYYWWNERKELSLIAIGCLTVNIFIYSFIHYWYFYSASAGPLLLRGAPNHSIETVSELTCRSAAGNCEWRTCSRSLRGGQNGIRTCDLPVARHRTYHWATTPHVYIYIYIP